jgi:hypothetical protein
MPGQFQRNVTNIALFSGQREYVLEFTEMTVIFGDVEYCSDTVK